MSFNRPIVFWIATFAAVVAVVILLREVLLPFVAGMVLAYLLDPVANRIERLGMNRLLATLVIAWRGQHIHRLHGRAMRPYRRELQAVFQDPYASLNPRMRAADIVAEPIRNFEKVSAAEMGERVVSLFEKVGLRPDQMPRYPYEFSGGQRQRLGIARALAPRPKLIVCDEPVSALDVSVQAQVINLLGDLQREFGLSYLFVAHDLAVVEHISHRVAVMYLGRIVELAPTRAVFAHPQHPYTEALLSAVPVPDPTVQRKRIILAGDVPSPIDLPKGCRFHTRCPYAFDRCRVEEPALKEVLPGHFAACHLRDALAVADSSVRH